ncbi:MAG: hypothetical protein WA208_07300 [Thermoanaerobaculia bacterium]
MHWFELLGEMVARRLEDLACADLAQELRRRVAAGAAAKLDGGGMRVVSFAPGGNGRDAVVSREWQRVPSMLTAGEYAEGAKHGYLFVMVGAVRLDATGVDVELIRRNPALPSTERSES